MTSRLRQLVGLLLAAILACLGIASPSFAAPAHQAPTYTFNSHHVSAQLVYPISERGAPATYDPGTTYSAVGRRSHGALVRPEGRSLAFGYSYDLTTSHAQVDNDTPAMRETAQAINGDP